MLRWQFRLLYSCWVTNQFNILLVIREEGNTLKFIYYFISNLKEKIEII